MIYNFHYVRLNTPDLGPYLLSHFYLIYIYKQLTSYHLHLSLIVYFEYFHIFDISEIKIYKMLLKFGRKLRQALQHI